MDRHNIVIQTARPADFMDLWPLLKAMGQTDSQTAAQERFGALVAAPWCWLPLARLDQAVVGYAWVQNYGPHLRTGRSTARLHDLYVATDQRRHGVGARLVAAVRDWCAQQGVAWLQWQASVAALPFYTRLGFTGDPCPDPSHPFYEIAFAADGT